MANFCRYCGKALQDGEICSCPQAQAEAAQQYQSQMPQQPPQQPQQDYQQPQQPQQPQPPQRPAGSNPFVSALQKILPYLRSYIKAPASAAQEILSQNDVVFAGIMLGIQAIVAALMVFSFLASICSALLSLATGGYGGSFGISIGPSFLMSLVFGILAGAAAIIIHVAIVFAITKILGVNRSFIDALVICAAHSPFVTVLLLVAFILFFLYLPLGMIFLLAAILSWVVLSVLSLQALAPDASQGKFWICAIVGALVALLVGGWLATFLSGFIPINGGGASISINDMIKMIRSEMGGLF